MVRRIITFLTVLLWLSPLVASARVLTFATYPSNDPPKLQRALTPLVDHLGHELGIPVRLVITADYAELNQRLAEGSVDLAWMGSGNYLISKHTLPGLQYLVTYQEHSSRDGRVIPYYQAVLITTAQSGITDLASARGKRLGFTDKGSTSGYRYPLMMMREQGIDPFGYFQKVFFLKKHDKVLQALLKGSIDLGAVSDGTYYNGLRRPAGESLRLLMSSDPIPLDALVAAPQVPPALVEKVRAILEAIPADDPINLAPREHLGWPAAGFKAMGDGFYDSLRAALRQTP